MAWFNRRRNNEAVSVPTVPTEATPAVPQVSFSEKMLGWSEDLAWVEKSYSNILSTQVYSELRSIHDVLESIAELISHYSIRTEEEYLIESTLKNYIPSALAIFSQLPPDKQRSGEEADLMLMSQCRNVKQNVVSLKEQLQTQIMNNLTTQTMFVEERFNSQL